MAGLRVSAKQQIWLLALLGTAIAALALARYWVSHPWRNQASDFLAKTEIPTKSIAVLQFQNVSNDRDNAFFGNGVQEQILTNLAKVSDLKIISHTSTQHTEPPLRPVTCERLVGNSA